jgi:hypothetical protein
MGFFDKLKTLVGEHGCKVEITQLENQDPAAAKFPFRDSVFKGNFKVTASKPCTILGHKTEICVMQKHPDGREEIVVLGDDTHDAQRQVIGMNYTWPYDMAAGDTKEDGFCCTSIDIPEATKKLSSRCEDLKFYVRVTADVKGTPMDAEAKVPFTVAL